MASPAPCSTFSQYRRRPSIPRSSRYRVVIRHPTPLRRRRGRHAHIRPWHLDGVPSPFPVPPFFLIIHLVSHATRTGPSCRSSVPPWLWRRHRRLVPPPTFTRAPEMRQAEKGGPVVCLSRNFFVYIFIASRPAAAAEERLLLGGLMSLVLRLRKGHGRLIGWRLRLHAHAAHTVHLGRYGHVALHRTHRTHRTHRSHRAHLTHHSRRHTAHHCRVHTQAHTHTHRSHRSGHHRPHEPHRRRHGHHWRYRRCAHDCIVLHAIDVTDVSLKDRLPGVGVAAVADAEEDEEDCEEGSDHSSSVSAFQIP